MKTYYELLHLPPDATPERIRRAKHHLAKILHPDRHHGDVSSRVLAEGLMQVVNEAYEVLMDPEKRRAYDRSLRLLRRGGPRVAPPAAPSSSSSPVRETPPPSPRTHPRRPIRGIRATFRWPRPHELQITLRSWTLRRERAVLAAEQYVADLQDWCLARGRTYEAYRRQGLMQLLVSDFGRPPLHRGGAAWPDPHLGATFDRLEWSYARRLASGD